MFRTKVMQHANQCLKFEKNLRNLAPFCSVFVPNVKQGTQCPDQYELRFNDGRLSTKTKSVTEIIRALVILKLCTNETLVDNGEKVQYPFLKSKLFL